MASYKYLNYFGLKEGKRMEWFADWKTSFFMLILKPLDRIGVTPNQVSFASFLSLVVSPLVFLNHPIVFVILLVVHLLLDGLDGSLARYQRIQSDAGAFTDIVVDQSGVIVICLALIHYGIISPFVSALYMISYIIMIMFLVLANSKGEGLRSVIRSKYISFILTACVGFGILRSLQALYWLFLVFSIYQICIIIILFFRVQSGLRQ